MRKLAALFLIAVIAPSLLLAWLAVRSLRDQQYVLERQQTLLWQTVADSTAARISAKLSELQTDFAAVSEQMFQEGDPNSDAVTFHARLLDSWNLAEVGFATRRNGEILSPSRTDGLAATRFHLDNGAFLGNREMAEVYFNVGGKSGTAVLNEINLSQQSQQQVALNNAPDPPLSQVAGSTIDPKFEGKAMASREPLSYAQSTNFEGKAGAQQQRKISPSNRYADIQKKDPVTQAEFSKVLSAEAEFGQLTAGASDGMLGRFLRNKLKLMFWHRLSHDPDLIVGAQLDLDRVVTQLAPLLIAGESESRWSSNRTPVCIALLDDNARPAAMSPQGFTADWKRPFAASELGDALPHWEVAVYLTNPGQFATAARVTRIAISLLIAVLVTAIAIGSWLIISDINRQLALTRQKTDFVSNVSHELKTPLTSIRMFSELLSEGRVQEPEKRRQYLGIIVSECNRLSRLIGNVLDFSRMDRGEKKYEVQPLDLAEIAREVAENYRHQLESAGFSITIEGDESLPIKGDCDSLTAVMVNLISNAEKYSGARKEIAITLTGDSKATVTVSDRGIGVPRGSEEKIFGQFYRAEDSLSSGIQGSGLGLTLSRQIARAHGGNVLYRPREGGGSHFSLVLPLRHAA